MLIFYGKYLDRRPFGYHNTVYDQMVGIFLPEVIMMMDDHLLRKEDPEMLALCSLRPLRHSFTTATGNPKRNR